MPSSIYIHKTKAFIKNRTPKCVKTQEKYAGNVTYTVNSSVNFVFQVSTPHFDSGRKLNFRWALFLGHRANAGRATTALHYFINK